MLVAPDASETSSPPSREPMPTWDEVRKTEPQQGDALMSGVTAPPPPPPPPSLPAQEHVRHVSLHHVKKIPARNNINGLSEETNIYTETRMLQDQTGRLRR